MAFSLQTVNQTGAAVIRVTFADAMPLSANPTGAFDATNRLNWTLRGPNEAHVELVRTVSADPFSFDLVCDAVLQSGNWTLSAADIRTPFGVSLDTDSLNFVSNGAQPYFNIPLAGMTSEVVVRQALNAALDGPGWRAFVAALGYSDQKNVELAAAAALQKNLATATGPYLENLAAADGVNKNPDVGTSDDVLRRLTLGLNANKVNTMGLEAVLRAYYGIDATVAHATAGLPEPYVVHDGDNLLFTVDGTPVEVDFATSFFKNSNAASAQEVATVINREFRRLGLAAEATEFQDPNTGAIYLRIYSAQNGIKGKLVFQGGRLDYALQFPTVVDIAASGQTLSNVWLLRTSANDSSIPFGTVRLVFDGDTSTLDIFSLFAGDYVNLYYQGVQTRGCTGTWQITAVDTNNNTVDFTGPLAPTPDGNDFFPDPNQLFFTRATVIRLPAHNVAFVAQAVPSTSKIVMAATTQAVSRGLKTAWYLNSCPTLDLLTSNADVYPTNYRGGPLRGASADLVTVVTAAPHGLTAGRYFFLDDVIVAESDTVVSEITSTVTPTVPNLFGRWNPCTGGYLGWNLTTHTFVLLSADATTLTSLGNAGIGGSAGPTMASLRDGRVLIVSDATTLIFDPVTATFTSATAPPHNKTSGKSPLGAATISDGRVVVTGSDGTSVWADIYNPTLNSWGINYQLPSKLFTSWNTQNVSSVAWAAMDWSPELRRFGMVGTSGSQRFAWSPDGFTWTLQTMSAAGSFTLLKWCQGLAGTGLWVAAGTDGTVATSPDGFTWTTQTLPSTRQWGAIAYSPESKTVVLIAQNGTAAQQVAYSTNGSTWTAATAASQRIWAAATWSPKLGLFLAVAQDGTASNQLMVSRNGISWFTVVLPTTTAWGGIAWSQHLGQVTMIGPAIALSSVDGFTWTQASAPGFTSYQTLIWSQQYRSFVGMATSSGVQLTVTSPDGVTWSQDGGLVFSGASGNITALADSPRLGLVAAANNGHAYTCIVSNDETNSIGSLTTYDDHVYCMMSSPTPLKGFYYAPAEDGWRSLTLPSVANGWYSMAYVNDGLPRGSLWLGTLDTSQYIFRIDLATNNCTAYAFVPTAGTPDAFRIVATPTNEVALVAFNSHTASDYIINPRAPTGLQARELMHGSSIGGTNDRQSTPVVLADGRIYYTDSTLSRWLVINTYSKFRQQSGGGLSGRIFKAETVGSAGPNSVSFRTPDFPYRTRIVAGTLTPILAETQHIGSGYMLDTVSGTALSGAQTLTTTVVNGGSGTRLLTVSSTVGFPNTPGYIVLGFGTNNQSAVIKYISVISGTQLLLDPGAVFPQRYAVGTTVDLLFQRGTFSPADSTPYGVTWLTGTAIGRQAAETDIGFAAASGLNVSIEVIYPGDRGLGNEGQPDTGVQKLSDAVFVWGSDTVDAELAADREA